jgi:hypothetical protein
MWNNGVAPTRVINHGIADPGRQAEQARGCGRNRRLRSGTASGLRGQGNGGVRIDGIRVAVTPDSIVVLRALGLGDLLTGIPALRGLRRTYAGAHIVLATPERFSALAMLSGAIDEVAATPGLGRLHPRHSPTGLAVNLHGSGPESIADLLTLKPRNLISHRHSSYRDLHGPPWRPELHEVDRWCAARMGWNRLRSQ